MPVPVAVQSKERTVLDYSNTGIMDSNCVLLCFVVLLCIDRDLSVGPEAVQEVLPGAPGTHKFRNKLQGLICDS